MEEWLSNKRTRANLPPSSTSTRFLFSKHRNQLKSPAYLASAKVFAYPIVFLICSRKISVLRVSSDFLFNCYFKMSKFFRSKETRSNFGTMHFLFLFKESKTQFIYLCVRYLEFRVLLASYLLKKLTVKLLRDNSKVSRQTITSRNSLSLRMIIKR
jgi:hypothetical protein